ncbi:MAG: asparagine synthase-related protein, partial [Sphingomonas sp.]
MRRCRFLGLVAQQRPLDPQLTDHVRHRLPIDTAFRLVRSSTRSAIFADAGGLRFDQGIVIGPVFRRGSMSALDALSATDGASIAASQGRFLIDAHWGGYVAFIDKDETFSVLRAPLGDLPCLIGRIEGALVVASDVGLLKTAGVKTEVDFDALARHVAIPDLRRAETCLAGVDELQGGICLTLSGDEPSDAEMWSPWTFADAARQVYDRVEAARQVREAILHSVTVSSAGVGPVVLKLSGGLDSSIVAAALMAAGRETTALNLVTDDRAGDERHYARIVANACAIDLVERRRTIEAIDLAASAAAHLPRPTARSFAQASAHHAEGLAHDIGGGAIMDGGGGDNVFCSLQSVRPVIDCLVADRGWRSAITTARSVATLAQVSQWTVLRRALIGRARGVSSYAFPRDLRLLSPKAIKASHDADEHRWLRAPSGALPGKAAHIGLIAAAQSVIEGFDPMDPVSALSPLITQPVVEACLAVPSWLWFDDGRNRAIARQAFADLLPETIVRRRSKGGPDGFIAELYRANRAQIRDWLLDGLLVAHDMLDRPALEAVLAEQGPVRRHDF